MKVTISDSVFQTICKQDFINTIPQNNINPLLHIYDCIKKCIIFCSQNNAIQNELNIVAKGPNINPLLYVLNSQQKYNLFAHPYYRRQVPDVKASQRVSSLPISSAVLLLDTEQSLRLQCRVLQTSFVGRHECLQL